MRLPVSRRTVLAICTLLVAIGLVFLDVWLGEDEKLRDRICDAYAVVHSDAPSDSRVVLIKLGEGCVGSSPHPELFPRDVLAGVIKQAASFHPKAIVLDVFLEEASGSDDQFPAGRMRGEPKTPDQMLLRAIREAGCVYIAVPTPLPNAGDTGNSVLELFAEAAAGRGYAGFACESDRVVRTADTWVPLPGSSQAADGKPNTLIGVVAKVLRANRGADDSLPEEFIINYHAYPARQFRVITFGMQDRGNAKIDSIGPDDVVVIGVYRTGSLDYFYTPLVMGGRGEETRGMVSGPELIAYSLDTLMQPRFPWRLKWYAEHLIAVAMMVGAFWAANRHNRRGHVLASLAALAAYIGTAIWAVAGANYLPTGIPVLAWVVGTHWGMAYSECWVLDEERAKPRSVFIWLQSVCTTIKAGGKGEARAEPQSSAQMGERVADPTPRPVRKTPGKQRAHHNGPRRHRKRS